jgi:hypothetical protein
MWLAVLTLGLLLGESLIMAEENWDALLGKQTMNVRTELFNERGDCNNCWAKQEVALLQARRLAQDLVPRKLPKNLSDTLQYIKNALQSVETNCTGPNSRNVSPVH